MPRENRFTIYDALEKKGYFDLNPANSYARSPTDGSTLYKGPVPYPKMLYHPLGEEKIVVAAEVLSTPMGPKEVGEQRELIWQIVATPAVDKALAADGWQQWGATSDRLGETVDILEAMESALAESTLLIVDG